MKVQALQMQTSTPLLQRFAPQRKPRLGGEAAGTGDDRHDQDECLTPVGGRIFVIDTPGPQATLNPRGIVFPGVAAAVAATATAAVWILSFAEWVIARNRRLGIDWVAISNPV